MTVTARNDGHGAGDIAMVSPVDDIVEHARRTRRARTRRGALLVAAVLVVLLGGVIAVNAGAAPAAVGQPAPPIPDFDECEPASPLPVCQWGSTSIPPVPTDQLPAPTPEVPEATTGCAPGQIGCPPPSSATPCVGEDCIPQPTTPGSGPGKPGQQGDEQVEDPGCGLLSDPTGCIVAGINVVFRGLVEAALAPILELLAATALSTPTLDQLPGIGELWNHSFELVVAIYGLLVLIGGIVVMSHESLQTRYSLKEIGPRIPVAFLASALSLFFVDKLIRLANALSTAVLGDGVDPPSLGTTLKDAATGALSGGLFLILTALVLVVVGIGLLIVYVVRVVITIILVITGPLFLMLHALPHTDGLARWWWKATLAVLAIQVAQSLVLIIAVRTLLSGGIYLFASFGAFGMLIGAIGLFFVVFKIPFWLLSAVKVGSGGSLIGGLAKAYIAAKTFGMISGRTAAAAGARSTPNNAVRRVPAATPASPRPQIAPSGAMMARRLRAQYDAERTRAARQSRRAVHPPAFLQPGTQTTTHDPAVDMTGAAPATAPAFSAKPRRQASPPAVPARRPHHPVFHAATRPGAGTPAAPIRVATTPPALRFRAAQPEPTSANTPVPAVSPPLPPTFRDGQSAPRVVDARRRTPSVPPITFRAPKPRGGDAS